MRQPGYQVLRSDGELQSLIRQANIKDADRPVDWDTEMVWPCLPVNGPAASR